MAPQHASESAEETRNAEDLATLCHCSLGLHAQRRCGGGGHVILAFDASGIRVLGTSARKPPLSDTLLWATLSLAHPFKIEVILSKRVDVLPKQRGCEAQNIVVDHLAFSAEFRVFSFCG